MIHIIQKNIDYANPMKIIIIISIDVPSGKHEAT